jgi:hypothetical protein
MHLDRDTYVIALSDDRWSLHLNGRELALFDERSHAERAADAAARMSRNRGRESQVVVDEALEESTS